MKLQEHWPGEEVFLQHIGDLHVGGAIAGTIILE